MNYEMRNKNTLYLLLSANIILGLAHGISMLAIPWYFTDILGRGDLFGKLFAGVTFLTLFWSLFSGTIIDRFSRKKVFMGLTISGATVMGSAALYGHVTGEMPIALVAFVFLATIFNFNVHFPNLYAYCQEITEANNYVRTNTLLEIQNQVTRMISGGVAAILLAGTMSEKFILKEIIPIKVEPWQLYEIFTIDMVAYIFAFFVVMNIQHIPIKKKQIERGNILKRMRTGFRFFKKNPLLFYFGNATYIIFVMVLIHIFYLMPNYVNKHLMMDADIYAAGEIVYSMGAILIGLSIQWISRRLNTVPAMIMSLIVTSAFLFLFGATRSVLVYLIFNAVIGVTNSGVRVLRITYLFERIPNEVIGRANSVFQAINILLRTAFASLFAISFFTSSNNVIYAYYIFGVVVLIFMIPLIFHYKSLLYLKPSEETTV
ncbi:MAG: MFS transporter [Flavobacteriales bacterium]